MLKERRNFSWVEQISHAPHVPSAATEKWVIILISAKLKSKFDPIKDNNMKIKPGKTIINTLHFYYYYYFNYFLILNCID